MAWESRSRRRWQEMEKKGGRKGDGRLVWGEKEKQNQNTASSRLENDPVRTAREEEQIRKKRNDETLFCAFGLGACGRGWGEGGEPLETPRRDRPRSKVFVERSERREEVYLAKRRCVSVERIGGRDRGRKKEGMKKL